MQTKARHIQQEAESQLDLEREACEKKFFVNDCRSDAYERYLEKLDLSRKMSEEGRRVEMEQRKNDREAVRAEQASEAAARLKKDSERAKTVAKEQEAREASYKARQIRRAAEAEKKAQKAAVHRENARKKEEKTVEKRTRQAEENAAKARNRNAQREFSESEETRK